MSKPYRFLAPGLLSTGMLVFIGATVTACGGGGKSSGSTSNAGGSGGSGGSSGSNGSGGSGAESSTSNAGGSGGSGGGSSNGSGGSGGDDAGSGGSSGSTGSGGSGGSTSTPANIDDVLVSVCEWEFRCCSEGERLYRLSPFAETAEECAERLTFQLRQSNATNNPYLSGPAAPSALLGTLAYVVDLGRVVPNLDGIAECVESWDDRSCNEPFEAGQRCPGPAPADPCALTNLFDPNLAIGDECTPELAQTAASNDVECMPGSTCLDVGAAGNPNDFPTCVQRGVEGNPCTSDAECDFDFFCAQGDCTEKSGPGQECSFDDPEEPAPGDEDIQCKAGLSCHPIDLECMDACELGSACRDDSQCPDGSGCAPIEVGESATTFTACVEEGDSAADLCNSDGDCSASHYCDGTNCQADKPANTACAAQNECAVGLHCDLVNTGTCVTNLAASAACVADYQCGPDSAGCLDTGEGGLLCRNNKLPLDEPCGADSACASNRCEVPDESTVVAQCVTGAGEDDACDALPTDGTAQRCAPGFFCFGDTGAVGSGTCVGQADPGESCVDPNDAPNAALCANGSGCTTAWDEAGICSDAPVPELNGGTGVMCDGD